MKRSARSRSSSEITSRARLKSMLASSIPTAQTWTLRSSAGSSAGCEGHEVMSIRRLKTEISALVRPRTDQPQFSRLRCRGHRNKISACSLPCGESTSHEVFPHGRAAGNDYALAVPGDLEIAWCVEENHRAGVLIDRRLVRDFFDVNVE